MPTGGQDSPAVDRCDLDVQSSVLQVRQQVVAVGADCSSGHPRPPPDAAASPWMRKTLQALQLHALEAHFTHAGPPGQSPQDLVFSKTNGTPLSPAYVSRHFDRIVHRTELPRIRLHDLRHTSASLALAGGGNPAGSQQTPRTLLHRGHRRHLLPDHPTSRQSGR